MPGIASAATHTGKVSGIGVSPILSGHGGFGLYNFTITSDNPGDVVFPFVERRQAAAIASRRPRAPATTRSKLRTEADLSLDNSEREHDRRRLHRRGPAPRVDPAQLVQEQPERRDRRPGRLRTRARSGSSRTRARGNSIKIGGGNAPNEVAAAGRATQLLADSATYYASVKNAADLSIDGGADLQTCADTAAP